jgi:chorismate synthase
MNYLKFVFENEDIRALTESNETTITSIVKENIAQFTLTNFTYVIENLEQFVNTENLESSYETIKEFVCNDMVSMMSAIAEVASIEESFDSVESIMSENVSSVFTGLGFGTQKAARLISTTYA